MQTSPAGFHPRYSVCGWLVVTKPVDNYQTGAMALSYCAHRLVWIGRACCLTVSDTLLQQQSAGKLASLLRDSVHQTLPSIITRHLRILYGHATSGLVVVAVEVALLTSNRTQQGTIMQGEQSTWHMLHARKNDYISVPRAIDPS